MKFAPQQLQKMSHQLVMTPQLQQAIKLLQLSRFELEKLIEQSLVENPTLDSDNTSIETSKNSDDTSSNTEEENESSNKEEVEEDWQKDLIANETSEAEWQEYSQHGAGQIKEGEMDKDDDFSPQDSRLTRTQSLIEYLTWQINVSSISDELKNIGEYLVGVLNDDGFLVSSVFELISDSGRLRKFVEEFIKKNKSVITQQKQIDPNKLHLKFEDVKQKARNKNEISEVKPQNNSENKKIKNIESLYLGLEFAINNLQEFDPPGVFARSIQECLFIQLKNLPEEYLLAKKIIEFHFPLLIKQDLKRISKLLKVDLNEIKDAKALISTLEPHPGRQFSSEPIGYIIPDVYVFKRENKYIVRMNNENIPRLSINNHYKKLSFEMNKEYGKQKNRSEDSNVLTNQYLVEKIRAAEWLIRSIEQRQKTILRVSKSIVVRQQDFFDHGITALKPMVLKDIAQDIDVHESTVSRITANKYMHTPQGIFELKFFFTSGIKQDDGDFISSERIKDLIQKMVLAENPSKPLTDSILAIKLENDMSIKVARRTVAKYREALNIAPSNQRKQRY